MVALSRFEGDIDAELRAVQSFCARHGVRAIVARHWADGGAGAEDLARAVVEVAEAGDADFSLLYPDDLPLAGKIETVCRRIYRADSVHLPQHVRNKLAQWEKAGFGHLPVCLAKTQYSFSVDPKAVGAPVGHEVPIRDVRLAAGAGFVVVLCGEIMTMPGLPRHPAAESIGLVDGNVHGLF